MKKGAWVFVLLALNLIVLPCVLAIDSSVSVEFTSDNGMCSSMEKSSYWVFGATKVYTIKEDGTTSDCFFKNPLTDKYNYSISCCPSGYDACVNSTEHPGGVCIEKIGLCSNLGSEGSCKSASKGLAEKTLGKSESLTAYLDAKNGICYAYSSAKCSWENTTVNGTSSFSCTAVFSNVTGINASLYNGNCTQPSSALSCVYQYAGQDEKCDIPMSQGGGIWINYTAWVKNNSLGASSELKNASLYPEVSSWCNSEPKVYECSAAIQLPFFSLGNFLISVLAIVGVYVVYRKSSLGGK